MRRIAILLGVTLLPSVAAAHPEHGSGEALGVLHYLTDPFHVGLTAVALLGLAAICSLTLRRRLAGRARVVAPTVRSL
jgi:hypothetical protein